MTRYTFPCGHVVETDLGFEKPNAQGAKHWTHRRPELVARGERHYAAKLNAEQVRHMRAMRGQGWTLSMLAGWFDIGRRHAGDICRGKKWAHV